MVWFFISLLLAFWWAGAFQAGFVDGFLNPISLLIILFLIAFIIYSIKETKREEKYRKQKRAQERANLPPNIQREYDEVEEWVKSKEHHQLCDELCGIGKKNRNTTTTKRHTEPKD